MISERKKYLIEIFLKKCTLQTINKVHLDFIFQLLKNTYPISLEKENKLREKFSLEEYIKKIIPIIDTFFSEEELRECIHFFSSPTGRKLLDSNFLDKIGKIGVNMTNQLEQEFALSYSEKNNGKLR